jgi:hypothetical protein
MSLCTSGLFKAVAAALEIREKKRVWNRRITLFRRRATISLPDG